jgi:hypothetical protein
VFSGIHEASGLKPLRFLRFLLWLCPQLLGCPKRATKGVGKRLTLKSFIHFVLLYARFQIGRLCLTTRGWVYFWVDVFLKI